MNRYARQTALPELGEAGQRRLAEASVLIIGAGGLGSPAALYLVAAGVMHIALADHDIVSETNLQRQVLYVNDDVDLPKADRAAKRLNALNPTARIDTFKMKFSRDNAAEIIENYDVIIDCTDNYRTRYDIDDACREAHKPWVHGSIEGFAGQVTLFGGRTDKHYTDLYPERDEMTALEAGATPVIGTTSAVIGSLEALEAIKWIAGIPSPLDGALFTIDTLTYKTNLISL